MLQDVEAGRDPEIDALVGSVLELADLTATPTPQIRAVYALVKLLSHTMSQEQVCVRASPPSLFDTMKRAVEAHMPAPAVLAHAVAG